MPTSPVFDHARPIGLLGTPPNQFFRLRVCYVGIVLAAGCATPSTDRPKYAAPGFNNKECAMVSPRLDPEQMKSGKVAKVKARAHFVDGFVVAIEILSGPKSYRQPVIDAMKQYTCKGALTFVAEQTFIFNNAPQMAGLRR